MSYASYEMYGVQVMYGDEYAADDYDADVYGVHNVNNVYAVCAVQDVYYVRDAHLVQDAYTFNHVYNMDENHDVHKAYAALYVNDLDGVDNLCQV